MSDDPFVRWLVRGGSRRTAETDRYLRLMLCTLALPRGRVEVAFEGDLLASAALWAPPGTWSLGLSTSLRVMVAMIAIVGLRRFDRVNESLESIERARPPEPRWLLTLLGTDPDLRKRGLASAALAPVLEQCDHDATRAVLETSEPANLAFYRSHGFDPIAEHLLEPEGPRCFTMVREPR